MAGLPRPSQLPEWASTALNNGPGGEPNIIEPSAAKKARGWDAQEFPPRNYFNWWMNLVYEWTCYLRDERDVLRTDVDTNVLDIGINELDITALDNNLNSHIAFAGTDTTLGHVLKATAAQIAAGTPGAQYLDPAQLAATYLKIADLPAGVNTSFTVFDPANANTPSSSVTNKIARMHSLFGASNFVRLQSTTGTITLFDDAILGDSSQRAWLIFCYGRTNTSSNGGNTYKGMRILNSGGGIILDRPSGFNANWVDGSAPVFDAHILTNGEVPANGILNVFIENRACDYICAVPMSVGYNI